MSKSNAFKIKKNLERVIKEVKHEDFVMFLKKKQEGILQSKSSNHIKEETINETIEWFLLSNITIRIRCD